MDKTPAKGYRQLRKGRKSTPGAYYFITVATYDRTHVLTETGVSDIIFECFNWLETKGRLKWLCIMIMPDHIHALLQLGKELSLSNLVYSLKRFTANQINVHLSRTGPLWQENYYDHAVRRDESLNEIMQYCYENPVRKGLVKHPADYPHWRCKFQMP